MALAATLQLYGAYHLKFPAALNGPQFLKGSSLKKPLEVKDGAIDVPTAPGLGIEIDRLTDLPKRQRLEFLDDMDTLGEAVEAACRATDPAFRRMNYVAPRHDELRARIVAELARP